MNQKLILGGAGFIGSNLVQALVARGERPRVFTRPSVAISSLANVLDQIDIVYGDFMDDVALRHAVQGVDTVIHLISTTFPGMTLESSVYDVLSNLLPTIRLVEICLASGVKKIVYASSGGTIYGEPQFLPITEDHPLTPKSAYGQSKLTIENYLQFYARSTNLDINVLRISNPFGPRQNPFGVQGIVAVAMGHAIHGSVLKIYGLGETIRDYIYIDEAVEAMLLAIDTPGTATVNISSGKGHSVLEIVQTIEMVAGCSIHKQFLPSRIGDVSVNILSAERAYQMYGWQAKVSLQEGMAKTWEWFKQRLNKSG